MPTLAEAVAAALDPTHVDERPLPWAEWRAAVSHAVAVLQAVDNGRLAPSIGSALIGNAARAIVTGTALALSTLLADLVDDERLSPDEAQSVAAMFQDADTPPALT